MKRRFLILSVILLASACQRNSYSTFSNKYKVFFNCETSVSPYNQLTAPGRFISVRKSQGKLTITDAEGNIIEETLSEKQNISFIMGLSGLILGTPMLNNDDMSIWAFDLGCPECDDPATILKLAQQGADFTASCSKCKGLWNLNTSGISINTGDRQYRPLYRYPTSFNNGILTVSN